jgi:hypothetical protein
MKDQGGGQRFSGRRVPPDALAMIREVVQTCAGVSRMELAHTVCELWGWTRPGQRACWISGGKVAAMRKRLKHELRIGNR